MNVSKISFLLLAGFLALFVSCDVDNECPEGNICVVGNTLEYQSSTDRAKLIIDVPEGAAYNNEAITVSDLVPDYPAQTNFQRSDLHFGGGWFMIEPINMDFKKLITISIQFPQEAKIDGLGNTWADKYLLYYVDHDNWTIVNDSEVLINENKVTGQVLRLGEYAVAAPKPCIVGDWRTPSNNSYGYNARVVFLIANKGWRELIKDCDPTWVEDLQPTRENFEWSLSNDTLLQVFNFSAISECGVSGTTSSDVDNIAVYCEDFQLELFGFNFYGSDFFLRYE